MLLESQNAVIDEVPESFGVRPDLHVFPTSYDRTLKLENQRLQAELRAQTQELRHSRTRLVAAGDAARRQLERDLHDGAQSRFVATALHLRLVQAKAPPDSEVASMLDAAIGELMAGIDELRELARGIHPAVLTERGLEAALVSLAGRAPIPVDVHTTLGARLPDAVEIAAYFAVSEALANVAKYAGAGRVAVDVRHERGRLVVEVTDDGCGGASARAGSGLRGLADRVGALDGRLEIHSPPGAGTRVRVEIPCRALTPSLRSLPAPGTTGLAISGPIAPADVPELCERARVHLEGSDADVLVCDVGALTDPDAGTIDALARLQLTARRLGREIRLRHASRELRDLLALFGLGGVLRLEPSRQPEEREQPRSVEERVERGDPTL